MAEPVNPVTREDWQLAVDAADACLCIEAARQYGLVTGGPEVDVDRARWIVAQGKLRGIQPRPTALLKFLEGLARLDMNLPGALPTAVVEFTELWAQVAGDCPCGRWHNPGAPGCAPSEFIGKPLSEAP